VLSSDRFELKINIRSISMSDENLENLKSDSSTGFYDTLEMQQILDFIEKENKKALSSDKIDQVAQAWSKVDREKLFKN
jgi:hypothetical protein